MGWIEVSLTLLCRRTSMLVTGAALIEVLPTHNNAASEAAAKIFFITISLVRSSPARAKTINFGMRASRYKTFVAEQRRKSCLMRTPVTSGAAGRLPDPSSQKLSSCVTLAPPINWPLLTLPAARSMRMSGMKVLTRLMATWWFRNCEGAWTCQRPRRPRG